VVTEERLVVVPPGVELEPLLAIERTGRPRAEPGGLRALVGAGPEDFLVGVLGRLAEVKRPELALEVLGLLRERHPRLQLVFLGDGTERRALERAIRGLGEGAPAHLVGAREDVARDLAELDAVLLTSRAEGLPVALIEAGAAGLPAVATPVGGVPELVVHERTGFLGSDATELALGLSQLASDPAEARAMGARARLRVAARHGAERLADRLEEVYEVALRERRGSEVRGGPEGGA
jgi:glycosyltransferase involved in cell wall biosynthesis